MLSKYLLTATMVAAWAVGCAGSGGNGSGGGPGGGGAGGISGGGGAGGISGGGGAGGISGGGGAGGISGGGGAGGISGGGGGGASGGGNAAFSVTAWLPSSPGPHPVVFLSAGLQQPGAAYAPYARRLASWGIVTLLRDDPGILGPSSAALVADLGYVVATWLPAQAQAPSGPLAGQLDPTRIGLAGHSRGGQTALFALEGSARGHARAFFGLDPVDSAQNGSESRTQLGSIGVPTVFLGETTDGDGCAPSADNYQVLYAAAAAPALLITAVGADHTMFEDPASCAFCTLCTAGSASAAAVLGYSVRYLTAFFARELLGDSRVGPLLDGAGLGSDVAAGLVQREAR
jgi:dienelactone hydrolase